jgi:hypothetical protein
MGYDTERSTDHDWGPGAQVYVAADDVEAPASSSSDAVPRPTAAGRCGSARRRPYEHHVTVGHVAGLARRGDRARRDRELDAVDWLLVPQQRLLSVVAGPVFADPTGELAATRRPPRLVPDDVWWWLLACQWRRLDQEEPFVQRTAEVGDDLGSAVLDRAARPRRDAAGAADGSPLRAVREWLGNGVRAARPPDGSTGISRTRGGARPERAGAGARPGLPGARPRHASCRRSPRSTRRYGPFRNRPALVLAPAGSSTTA